MNHNLLQSLLCARSAANSLTRSATTGALLAATLLVSGGFAHAQSTGSKFVPFGEFVQNVRSVDAAGVLARPEAKVSNTGAFEEMRQHLLRTYEGVSVSHTYALGSQTVDCIPVMQQPAVRQLGLNRLAEAPPSGALTNPDGITTPHNTAAVSQLPADKTADEFGNMLGCEDQTVPMVRMTLEQLSRFHTLREFFEKGPNGSGHAPEPGKFAPAGGPAHKYAFTYQYVNNHGDNDDINLWRPYIYTDLGEIFSLAQSWTIGTSAAPVQTAEVGWQNYPGRTGTEDSVLFIYWTEDGYQNTGCYDLTCAGFVQVSKALTFGAPFTAGSYSVSDGAQHELQLQYYLYNGNWWLMGNGTWLGYYPGSLYKGGQLSKYSNLLEFGSESVGTTVWPAEGSGLFAANGWTYSGYQRELWYRNTSSSTAWDTLTVDEPSPACYTASKPASSSNWGVYFYFGGPGGASCQ